MTAQRFRKQPVVVEAIHWEWNTAEVRAFVGTRFYENEPPEPPEPGFLLVSETSGVFNSDAVVYDRFHGWVPVMRGQWIIRGIQGEFYPCEPGVFAATYEPMADGA